MIEVYTDASANQQFACSGFTAYENHVKTSQQVQLYRNVTVNLAELLAVLWALMTYSGQSIMIYSDSKYVVETLTGNYKVKRYQTVWNKTFEQFKTSHSSIHHVKAHSTNGRNNEIDQVVRKKLREQTRRSKK